MTEGQEPMFKGMVFRMRPCSSKLRLKKLIMVGTLFYHPFLSYMGGTINCYPEHKNLLFSAFTLYPVKCVSIP